MPEENKNDIIAIINDIFYQALTNNASDIHIEPKRENVGVRMRIDGEFGQNKVYPIEIHQPMITRMKILADLKIDETRLPQDGKASMTAEGENVDLRISVLPTIYGEKICIRILKTNQKKVDLEELGILDYALQKIYKALKKKYGIILTTGPTGAGKTTSLYGMLSHYDPKSYNISTLEDPVEYKMNDVNQTQINRDIGFDFSDGLRTLVRQDPDIIMVGEIRDRVTASLAVESALTGHLVFSTIHTNTASATIQRLLNMGVEKFLLPSAMQLIIAQRLARKICDNCKELYVPNDNVISKLKDEIGHMINIDQENIHLYKGKGCSKCENTGFSGRVGVYEVMEISQVICELILEGAPTVRIEEAAIKDGMLPMKKDGLLKVVMGLTTFEEVLSLVGGF